eukprot:6043282-Amphidinium_carterae.1
MEQFVVYSKTQHPDPNEDIEREYATVLAIRALLDKSGLVPAREPGPGNVLRPEDVFQSGHFWYRHPRGFDGLLQEGWSIVYAAPIQKTEAEQESKVYILIRGDDLLLIVIRPTRHGIVDGEEYKRLYPGDVMEDHQSFTEALYRNFESVGLEVKEKQSTPASTISAFGKVIMKGTVLLPQLTKSTEKISPLSNSGFPTVVGMLQQIRSDALAAQVYHPRPELPTLVGLYQQTLVLLRTERYDPLRGSSTPLLVPDVYAGWKLSSQVTLA